MASGKIKYPKLRLFKPSTSGSSGRPEVAEQNGESPKESPKPEVIDLVDDSDPEPDEKMLKRTRLEQSPESPVLRLPKLPRKPPEGASGMINKFFKTSEDDFEPAKKEPTKAKTKVQRKTTTRKPRAHRKSSQDIRKAFQKYQDNDELLLNDLIAEHSRAEQVDPEQLQLAIAMSRSLSEQQADDIVDSQLPEVGSSASESTLQERRLQGIRTTLEQYGFKCKGNYQDQDLNALFGTAAPKNSRRAKTRRKTMLIRRTPAEIVAFMERGANLLQDLHPTLKPSENFQPNSRTYGSDVFWMSENPNLDSVPEYFIEGLVEPLPAKAGCLLRDWHAIPGRERTPERKIVKPPEPEVPEPLPEVPDPNLSELLQDPVDALLDMNTVPDEYRAKYNNEVLLPVRRTRSETKSPAKKKHLALPEVESVNTKQPEILDGGKVQNCLRPEVVPPETEQFTKQMLAETSPEVTLPEAEGSSKPKVLDNDEVMVICDDDAVESCMSPEVVVPPEVQVAPAASSPELFGSDVEEKDPEEDEDGLFQTAPEVAVEEKRDGAVEGKSQEDLCVSSDDMFEDFDPDPDLSEPIVDCDTYSSEEVKMSTSTDRRIDDPDPDSLDPEPSRKPTAMMSPRDDAEPVVISLSSGDSSNSGSVDRLQLKRRSSSMAVASTEPTEPEVDEEMRGEKEPRLFPSPGRELSFHALALKGRLSEVPAGDELETIEVEVEEDPADGGSSTSEDDEVLVISDEEVNYSIRKDYSLVYNVSPPPAEVPGEPKEVVPGEDPNSTKVYFDLEDFKKRHSDAGSCKADNTMAFLDGLIEKFNLPPAAPAASRSSCDNQEESQNQLDDYMEHYEIPDFPDDSSIEPAIVEEVPNEPPVSTQPVISSDQLDNEIEQILNQAKQTCTQLEQESRQNQPKIHRTKSDSALLAQPNPKPPPEPFLKRFKPVLEEPAPAPVRCEITILNDATDPSRPDYNGMTSPMLERELFKYGLKQLRRPKAVKMLNHIYDQLHPVVELVEVEEEQEVETIEEEEDVVVQPGSSRAQVGERKELKKTAGIVTTEVKVAIGEGPLLLERKDGFAPEIMDDEAYVLAVKPRKKTFWCSVPLHIAFYNMVKANPALRRRIFRYEPLDLDAIVGHLKEIGLRYDSNEMIAFLDKRCIAFRSAQSNSSGSTAAAGRKKKTGAAAS